MGRRKLGPAVVRARAAKAQRERRKWYAARGICVSCGSAWAEPGHTQCEKCRADARRNCKKYDPDGGKHRAYVKALRDERRAAGLCIDCGSPAEAGQARCPACAKKHREGNRLCSMRKRMKREAENERRMLLERQNARP